MNLIIDNKLIDAPIHDILDTIRKESRFRYFNKIQPKGDNYTVTCPYHKGGQENKPSAQVYCGDSEKTEFGTLHCFTCNVVQSLPEVVSHCLGLSEEGGKQWLIERFSNTFVVNRQVLTDIELKPKEEEVLDPSVLNKYNYYHEYMWKRKLEKWVVDTFCVGFNPETQSITFPVWDIKGNLKMVTERSVKSKLFYIPEGIEKPVYLLNVVTQYKYPFVLVCEAQLDALTAWGYGVPAVALMGTGSTEQFKLLNKCGIRNWVTMFDNDEAGKRATDKFNRKIKKDCMVTNISYGKRNVKDINDLSKEEFDSLLGEYGLNWRIS